MTNWGATSCQSLSCWTVQAHKYHLNWSGVAMQGCCEGSSGAVLPPILRNAGRRHSAILVNFHDDNLGTTGFL